MKKIKLILLSLVCAASLYAQNVAPSEEDKAKGKEINNIKKSGDAFYSDVYVEAATESEALTEAEQKSMDLMKVHVNEIFAKRLGMSKKDVQEIWGEIEKRCKHVVLKRGDLYRIFTYVLKAYVDPEYPTPAPPAPESEQIPVLVPQPEPKDTVVVPTPPAPEPTPVLVDGVAINKSRLELTEGDADNLTASVSPVDAANKKITWSSNNPSVATIDANGNVTALKEGAVVITVTTEDGGKTAVCEVVVKAKEIEVIIPALCQKLIATKTFDGLMSFLKQEKAKNTLMWGNANKMQRHELCYIVAVDRTTKEIVAVLDKGESERMNFMNKKKEHARNYRGTHSCIYIQEY